MFRSKHAEVTSPQFIRDSCLQVIPILAGGGLGGAPALLGEAYNIRLVHSLFPTFSFPIQSNKMQPCAIQACLYLKS